MKRRFLARLEGGPFDGLQGAWTDIAELPQRCWVFICSCGCRQEKWDYEWVEGAEPYTFDRMGPEGIGIYVYADVAPSIGERDRELTTA